MHKLAQLDRKFVWHPFTQMRDWLKQEPTVIFSGQGTLLHDVEGREYLDANSSIWTNLHGHNHPRMNQAIQRQLRKIAHSSALGLANEPASLLAEKLIQAANHRPTARHRKAPKRATVRHAWGPLITKVFYSDDGSTAMEVALKLAYEHHQRTRGVQSPFFLSLENAYHGDTVGALSLGHIDLFQRNYGQLTFPSDKVAAPYCYRCPYNRAQPERRDAREYRSCKWECISKVEAKFTARQKRRRTYSAFVFEPLIQGAAGMIAQPDGWLGRVAEIARYHGTSLIADEVLTGFGRTGVLPVSSSSEDATSSRKETTDPSVAREQNAREDVPMLFASHRGGVQPDFLALAKGLTGGYLPMGATLTNDVVFDSFLGEYDEFKTFFHGHSYTANQLGSAAALESLAILQKPSTIRSMGLLERAMRDQLKSLWSIPNVGDIRQCGLIAGIELVKDWRTRKPYDLGNRVGIRVCEAMKRRGVLTRPIGNVIVLMPPYCTTPVQVRRIVEAMFESITEVLRSPSGARGFGHLA